MWPSIEESNWLYRLLKDRRLYYSYFRHGLRHRYGLCGDYRGCHYCSIRNHDGDVRHIHNRDSRSSPMQSRMAVNKYMDYPTMDRNGTTHSMDSSSMDRSTMDDPTTTSMDGNDGEKDNRNSMGMDRRR